MTADWTRDPFERLSEFDQPASAAATDDPLPTVPVPQHAPAPRFGHRRLGQPTRTWAYHDASGRLVGHTARFDTPDGKDVLPLTWCTSPSGGAHWMWKMWASPRPLYGLDRLAARPDAPVLLVEGEKTADAAAEFFPEHVAVTWPGGANVVAKADWSTLQNRSVAMWPDADAAGRGAARDIVRLLPHTRVVDLPQSLPEGWDLADPLPNGLVEQDLVRLLAEAKAPEGAKSSDQDPDPWSRPDFYLLGTGRRPASDFPLQLLGPFWAEWATLRAEGASAPVDYVAVSLLASVGAMLANVRWPLAGANWSEPPVLWCGLVGSPSSGKSPAMDAAFDLVRHAEDILALGFDDEQRRIETAKQVAKARREAWDSEIKAAVKTGQVPPRIPDDAIAPNDPVRPRIRVADFTIEKLGLLAAGLPRGLLVVRDELSGWFGGFEKYGGGGADRAFAIEMYGGRSYVVDRVETPDPISIRHLSIGVLGGIQPDKLGDIIEGPDDGLAARLLWAWPETRPTFTLCRSRAADGVAKAAFARLAALTMGSDLLGQPEPKRLPLSAAAESVLEAFGREAAERANAATGIFAGALGKARGHVLRLAAVLEHLWWSGAIGTNGTIGPPEPLEISEQAVLAAAGLLDGYFIPMAERVFGDASIPAPERAAMALARHLQRARITSFNARVTRREVGGALRESAAMNTACDVLVDAGLIRPCFVRSGGTGGRAARNYGVNPALFGRDAG